MKTKHTPGPWKTRHFACCTAIETDTESRITSLFDHFDYQGKPCGSIESQDKTQDEIDANARLIAAAPALLEALKAVVAKVDQLQQTDGFKQESEWLGPFVQNEQFDNAKAAIAQAEQGA